MVAAALHCLALLTNHKTALRKCESANQPDLPMTNTCYNFQQLNEALLSCTSYYLTKETNEDDNLAYALRDGCGDQSGDLFDDLYDVQAHITEHQNVFNYLANFTGEQK